MTSVFYVDQVTESPKNVSIKRNTSRAKQLSAAEKRKLAELIRHRSVLWDPAHPSTKDVSAHERAWRDVANELVKPVEMCKLSWRSLRDCYRYRRKVGEKMRDNGEIKDPLEYIQSNWEFADDMAFLCNTGRPKGRYITYTEDGDVYNAPEHDESSNNSLGVKHEYISEVQDPIDSSPAHKKQRVEDIERLFDTNDGEENAEFLESVDHSTEVANPSFESSQLVTQLGKLVQAQTEFVREFKNNSTDKLTFKTQLIAVDALLQQLPKKTAEKTLVEMQNYVLKKVNEYHRNKSDSD